MNVSGTIIDLLYGILAVAFAGLLAFTLTPPVRVLAHKLKAIDIPEDDRRMHKKPIPRMGGLAIFSAFFVTVFIFCPVTKELLGVLLGALIIVILGIFDDIYRLNAWIKLIVQIFSACIPVALGVRIGFINFFGKYIPFDDTVSFIVTVFWIVAVTNAVNLIDGLDGLACGVSTISAFSIMVLVLLQLNFSVALVVAILAGSCLGFLPYNRNPAVIFMGDTGALFLGYTLSSVSVLGLFKVNAFVSFWIPFLVFALPLADTVTATIRRLIHKQSIFSPDRGHFHHKLIDIGFTQKQAVAILYSVSIMFSISAITFSEEKVLESLLIIIVSFVVGFLNYKILLSDAKTRNQTGLRLKKYMQGHDTETSETTNESEIENPKSEK
ncbi:MAG: undecaprenyl/decaprenyl-phosphate alpha-N-acetylglucosaminyl 1-phosphate transferase [Ruminococcaceae bacterium]|nr:undecaprenyl/decaprenyl-phosphate alpha-N-acetylglucosaminyl 1-phosphate transferase [Oscillospiraceae bacterium]